MDVILIYHYQKLFPGCETDLDMNPVIVKDSLQFEIDDTNGDWDIAISYNGQELCT